MAKLATTTPRGREQHHMIKYMLMCQQRRAKWLIGASGFDENSVALQRGCFTRKKQVLNQLIAALRRSVGLLGQFVTVWKNQTGHPPTQLL